MPVEQAGTGFIYGIADPVTMQTVYIGETVKSISSRLFHHLSKSLDPFWKWFDNPFPKWLREHVINDRFPIVYLLETLESSGDAQVDKRSRLSAEKFWIEQMTHRGVVLFNADRSEVSRKMWAQKSTEERSEIARKVAARKTSEMRMQQASHASRSVSKSKRVESATNQSVHFRRWEDDGGAVAWGGIFPSSWNGNRKRKT